MARHSSNDTSEAAVAERRNEHDAKLNNGGTLTDREWAQWGRDMDAAYDRAIARHGRD